MGVNECYLSDIYHLLILNQIFIIDYDQRNQCYMVILFKSSRILLLIFHVFCIFENHTVFLVNKHGYIVVVEARVNIESIQVITNSFIKFISLVRGVFWIQLGSRRL